MFNIRNLYLLLTLALFIKTILARRVNRLKGKRNDIHVWTCDCVTSLLGDPQLVIHLTLGFKESISSGRTPLVSTTQSWPVNRPSGCRTLRHWPWLPRSMMLPSKSPAPPFEDASTTGTIKLLVPCVQPLAETLRFY